jgi:hypothetical protein
LFDPIGIETDDKNIKIKLVEFLKKEINFNEKNTHKKLTKKFSYKNMTESDAFDVLDSGVYILKQAIKTSTEKSKTAASDNLENFRYKLLYSLFKHCTKVML